ncbi:MAG: A24 family peptidase [Acidobacteriales bacterium]|nr:A24 family peptidase [Terriglobales bacterium]
MTTPYIAAVPTVLLLTVSLTAAVYDFRFRRIPNWLSVTGALAGLAVNSWIAGLAGLKASAMGLGIAFGIYFVLYLLRAMGAGDVKLMAALGAIAGPDGWIWIFLLACILGGVIAIVLLLTKGRVATTLWNVGFILKELSQFRAPYMKREELDVHNPKAVTLPHGVSIALGVLVFVVLNLLR